MSVSQVTLIYALLAVAGALFLFWLGVLAIASRFSDSVADSLDTIRERLAPYALPGAFTVALLAVVGSLYFSEIAQFEPCRLCWYQRIAMYPLVVALVVGGIRRDRMVWTYVIPPAVIGSGFAIYHTQLQAYPQQHGPFCKINDPCTVRYVWEFGFVSIPFMALAAFALIITLMLVLRSERSLEYEIDELEPPDAPSL